MRDSVWRRWVATTGSAALVLVTGCSSSGTDDSSGSSAQLSGEPVNVMVIAPLDSPRFSIPEVKAAAEAAEASINDAGGINGRPLKVILCDDKFDPSLSASCANKAVDEAVTAVTGASLYAANTVPILEAAGIPLITGFPFSNIELTSKTSYPLTGGTRVEAYAGARRMVESGAKNIALVRGSSANAKYNAEAVISAIEDSGGTVVRTVEVAAGAPDYSPYVASALEGDVQGLTFMNAETDFLKFYKAARQQGFAGPVGTGMVQIGLQHVSSLGDGPVFTSSLFDPQAEDFNASMDKYAADANRNAFAQGTWVGLKVVAVALEGATATDAAGLIKALDGQQALDVGPSLPVLNFTQLGVLGGAPRVFNAQTKLFEVKGGKLVADGEFMTPVESIE